MIRFVAVTCPQCAGTQPEVLPDGHYRCRHCGTTFLRGGTGASSAAAAAAPARGRRGALVAGALAAGLVVTGALLSRRPAPPPPRPLSAPPRAGALVPRSRVAQGPVVAPRVELRGIKHGRTRSGGEFWLMRYANVGAVPVVRPAAVVSLFDEAGRRVEEQAGYAARQQLPPGQEVGVMVLVARPPAYARAEVAPRQPESSGYARAQVELPVKDPQVRAGGLMGADVVGTVRNPTDRPVRFIQLVVSGLDERGELVSLASGYATSRELAPGAESGFKVHGGSFVITPPVRYEVQALATP